MTSLHLETGLGILALLLVLAESFGLLARRAIVWVAMAGLVVALVLLCCLGSAPVPASLQSYYTTDHLALFYKGLALVSTLAVLAMSLEYAHVVNSFV